MPVTREAIEHLHHLREIINRSENMATRARMGFQNDVSHSIREIDRDFYALHYIASKHCPHKCHSIKKLHAATIARLMKRISAEQYHSVLQEFGKNHRINIPLVEQKRRLQNPSKSSYSPIIKMFRAGR